MLINSIIEIRSFLWKSFQKINALVEQSSSAKHTSKSVNTDMTFSVFVPAQEASEQSVPVLYYLFWPYM